MIFSKWHALGNDFVILPIDAQKPSRGTICAMGDRKTGIGFDQLLWLKKSNKPYSDFDLAFYNQDGSQAEICGNGLRAAGLFCWKTFQGAQIRFSTQAGVRTVSRKGKLIKVEMGKPEFLDILKNKGLAVNAGNPHFVIFTKKAVSDEELHKKGSALESHKGFENRTNVEFAQIRSASSIDVQVFERGVGITDACGSGAIATCFAAQSRSKVKSPVEVRFRRGKVKVDWNSDGVYSLIGDAHFVYDGKWNPK